MSSQPLPRSPSPAASSGGSTNIPTSSKWPLVSLSEILTLSIDAESVDPAATYRMSGVYSFGRGLMVREPLAGSNTTYRVLHRLHKDDMVLSQLKAWEGAIAHVTEKFDGWYLSPQFPTFRTNPELLDVGFFESFCKRKQFWESLKNESRGMGARRDSVNPKRFLSMHIPLPPLTEQKRIVARIEALSSRIEQVGILESQRKKELDLLPTLMAHRQDLAIEKKLAMGWKQVRLGEVIKEAKDPRPVQTSEIYPNLGIYSFGRGLFQKPPIEGLATSASVLYRVRSGQFIYSRLFAFEGSYGMVTNEFDGLFVSNEYPQFDLDQEVILVEFLYSYFRLPSIWKTVAVGSKGLGDRRQRVQPDQILNHIIMLPPIQWQQKIRMVSTTYSQAKAFMNNSNQELDALLPSILDKAFKGEL